MYIFIMLFIDLEKVFDNVRWNKLFEFLEKYFEIQGYKNDF